ncbi:MAG: hypothetical protein ACE5HF_07310 [Gemmatimonadota bacterium]
MGTRTRRLASASRRAAGLVLWIGLAHPAVGAGQTPAIREAAAYAEGIEGAERADSSFLSVRDHPDREKLVLALGPIDLPAHSTHHSLKQLPVQQGTVPFDLTIDGYRVEAVDRDGRPVPQVVIHHLNLLDPTRRELFLPIMRRVLAASHETPPVKVPEVFFGIPLTGGAPFLLLTMLHNPTDVSYEGVEVRLIVNYSRSRVVPLYRVFPFHMDVMFPLGSKAFDLPPGRFSKSWEGSPAIGGGIIGIGGHLHRYATELKLEDVTTGRVLYRVEPELGEDGHIAEVPVRRYRGRGIGLHIEPSHVYRVTATYVNPTDSVLPEGGMGSVAGAFIADDAARWPWADASNPIFARDYENVLTSTTMKDMEMPGHDGADHDHGTDSPRGR